MTSRSIYGCWTCRLRKKKCDENRPSCFRCTSLQLECDGYGPRPYWMDRGELQREEARRLKHIFSDIKSSVRQQKVLGTSHNGVVESGTVTTGNSALPNFPLPTPAQDNFLPCEGLSENTLRSPDRNGDTINSSDSMWSSPLYCSDFTANSYFDRVVEVSAYDQQLPFDAFRVSKLTCSATDERSGFHFSDVGREDSSRRPATDTVIPFSDPVLNTLSYGTDPPVLPGYSIEESSLCPIRSAYLGSGNISNHFGPSDSTSGMGMEDNLFMHYFDDVFYVHCPFYSPSNQRGRGWLLSILKRNKSAYHATLALSEYHQSSSSEQDNSRTTSLKGTHYNLALQELQMSLARLSACSESSEISRSIGGNIEVLTSILHLLFYEMSNGGKQNWQMHLRAATALLPPIVQAYSSPTAFAGSQLTIDRKAETIPTEDHVAISFLLGFFIHFDILSYASTRSSQFLTFDYKLSLESGETNLEILTGCSNWVMIFIFEISSLDKWREEESKAQKLSLLELTNRGRQIESRLRRRLANIENGRPRRVNGRVRILPDSDSTEITRIFALSAVTYLHVVISGAYPDIPEIKESVTKTIEALQNLQDPRLLRNLAWPFCISGCLAVDGQHSLFRELVSSSHSTHLPLGTCVVALEIMEECWRLRRHGYNHDWAHIMKKRGEYILLG